MIDMYYIGCAPHKFIKMGLSQLAKVHQFVNLRLLLTITSTISSLVVIVIYHDGDVSLSYACCKDTSDPNDNAFMSISST